MGFPGGSMDNQSAYNAGDMGSIPGLGRFPGGVHGNPLQYSCQEHSLTEEPGGLQSIELQSWTRLKRLSARMYTHSLTHIHTHHLNVVNKEKI